MARCARERKLGSVYHIQQTCLTGNCLFRTDEETNQFLNLLEHLKSTSNFKLYGAVLSPDHFELLIYPEYADISSVMRSLMIQYANVKQQSSPLCKERFKSTCISKNGEFIDQLVRFEHHGSPNKTTFIDNPHALLGLPVDTYNKAMSTQSHSFDQDLIWRNADLCIQSSTCCVSCVKQGKQALEDKLNTLQLKFEDLNTQKVLRNKLVRWFRQNSTLTLKEIGHVLGDLSESTVSKILKANTNEKR